MIEIRLISIQLDRFTNLISCAARGNATLLHNKRVAFYASVFVASLGLGLYLYFVPIFAQRLGATFLDLGFIGTAGALTYAVAPFFCWAARRSNKSPCSLRGGDSHQFQRYVFPNFL